MKNLRKSLPPPNSLVAFEAAARHGKFSAAAAELGVTSVAITRHIQVLENWLGVELFERSNRVINLTSAGNELFSAVAKGFDHIADVSTAVRSDNRRRIRVFASTAFSTFVLQPLLTAGACGEEVDVHMVASDEEPEIDFNRFDVYFVYGSDRKSGHQTTLLIRETIFPICSADYRMKYGAPATPSEIINHRLIHFQRKELDWVDWRVWLREFDVHYQSFLKGSVFSDYSHVLEAVMAGQGLALGWGGICDGLIRSNRIEAATTAKLVTDRGYYMITAGSSSGSPLLANFTQNIAGHFFPGANGSAESVPGSG